MRIPETSTFGRQPQYGDERARDRSADDGLGGGYLDPEAKHVDLMPTGHAHRAVIRVPLSPIAAANADAETFATTLELLLRARNDSIAAT